MQDFFDWFLRHLSACIYGAVGHGGNEKADRLE